MSADWPSFPFTHDGVTRDVYSLPGDETRRAIVILHELGGISAATLDFATGLHEDRDEQHPGFNVFIPAMFGNLDQRTGLLGTLTGPVQMMCARAEFRAMQWDSSSPIAGWMRALCREVAARTGHTVGLVGMCLTGGVVFSMVWDPAVTAVVSGQPSLPFKLSPAQLTVSERDFTEAARSSTRATDEGPEIIKRIQLHYFDNDKLCSAARVEALRERWSELADDGEIDVNKYPSEGKRHATLTEQAEDAVLSDGRKSRDIVREFFEKELA